MKITAKDLTEIMELINNAETFRPIIKTIVDAVKSYGPELQSLIDPVHIYSAKRTIANIAIYEEAGFSREDAITLVVSSKLAAQRISDNLKIKK